MACNEIFKFMDIMCTVQSEIIYNYTDWDSDYCKYKCARYFHDSVEDLFIHWDFCKQICQQHVH